MLKIWFGKNYPFEGVITRVDHFFDTRKKKEWFSDEFNQKMIYDVDHGTKVLKDFALENPLIGGMSPDKLSGGVKTLILIKEMPDLIFDATNCGDNCFKWLFKMCETLDRTVVLRYQPIIPDVDTKFICLNDNSYVNDASEMAVKSMDYLFTFENTKLQKEMEQDAEDYLQQLIIEGRAGL